jgi:hypothetical protein
LRFYFTLFKEINRTKNQFDAVPKRVEKQAARSGSLLDNKRVASYPQFLQLQLLPHLQFSQVQLWI